MALSGAYKQFPILPMKNLIEQLQATSVKNLELEPQLEVVTERYRTHLTIKSPWGVGPNPEHAFIITIDKASARSRSNNSIRASHKGRKLLEIEIEIDRNTSTEINRVAALPRGVNPLTDSSIVFSKTAQKNLKQDLGHIKSTVAQVLTKKFELEKLSVKNKYSRFVSWFVSDN